MTPINYFNLFYTSLPFIAYNFCEQFLFALIYALFINACILSNYMSLIDLHNIRLWTVELLNRSLFQ